jgi:hypothetical protein
LAQCERESLTRRDKSPVARSHGHTAAGVLVARLRKPGRNTPDDAEGLITPRMKHARPPAILDYAHTPLVSTRSPLRCKYAAIDVNALSCKHWVVMNERDYRRLRAQVEREYQQKLDALELVWNMAQGQKEPATRIRSASKGSLLAGIRDAVAAADNSFTLRDIERWLHNNRPELIATKRASISSTLKRLVGDKVEVVELGSGKRATVYRRSESGPA